MTDYPDLARRIQAIASDCPELTHTFSYAIGAVYALRQAERIGIRNRGAYEEIDRAAHMQVLQRVTEALQAEKDPENTWIGGFMYNSAIPRIDACYERFLKAIKEVVEKQGLLVRVPVRKGMSDTEKCALEIEASLKLAQPLARVYLEENRGNVNRLKHHLFGREATNERSRTIGDIERAAAALDELLAILERVEIHTCLDRAYKALPPA